MARNYFQRAGLHRNVALVLSLVFVLVTVAAFVFTSESSPRLRAPADSVWTQYLLRASRNPVLRPVMRQAVRMLQSRPELLKRFMASIRTDGRPPEAGMSSSGPFVLTFPQTVNGQAGNLRITTLLVVINNGGANATGTVSFRQSGGDPMVVNTNLGSGSEFEFALEAGEILRLETDGAGSLVQGWTEVVSDLPLSGSGAFSTFSASGDFLSSAGIGDSPRATRLMLFVDTTEGKQTGFAVCNPDGSLAANYTLTLKDLLTEATVAEASGSLPSFGQFAQFVPEAFPGEDLSNFKGIMIVESDNPISVVTLRTRGVNFTSLPAVAVAVADPDVDEYSLLFARIGDGVFGDLQFTSSLILLNNSDQAVTASVEFFREDGQPLSLGVDGAQTQRVDLVVSAGGGAELLTDGNTSPGVVGWARVNSELPLQGGASFTITSGPNRNFVSEVGVPSSTATARPSIFVRELSRTTTGLALTNVNALPVTLRLRLTGRTASSTAPAGVAVEPLKPTIFAETTLTLAPLSHIGQFVPQMFPQVDAIMARDFEGRLEVEAYLSDLGEPFEAPVAGLTLLSEGNILTSLPAAEFVINSGPTARFLPATLLPQSTPAFCLNIKQAAGEIPFRKATIALDRGRFETSAISDAMRIGDTTTSLFFYLFNGRNFATEIEPEGLAFYSPLTFDGMSDSVPYWGTIANLPEGGVRFEIESNSSSSDPLPLTSIFRICFDAGYLQLPTGDDTPINVSSQYRSEHRPDGSGSYATTRRWQVRTMDIASQAPKVEFASDRRVTGGQELVLTGSGFSTQPGQNMVTVHGSPRLPAEVLEAGANQLRVKLPYQIESGPLRVESQGRVSNDYQLESVFAPAFSLSFDSPTPGDRQLVVSFTQALGQISLLNLALKADSGDWITDGFAAGDVIGFQDTESALGESRLNLVVRSSSAEMLELEALEEDSEDPTAILRISNPDGLTSAPPSLGLSTETPGHSTTITFTRPVFRIPGGGGPVTFHVTSTSAPERTSVVSTSLSVAETIEIGAN